MGFHESTSDRRFQQREKAAIVATGWELKQTLGKTMRCLLLVPETAVALRRKQR
jgi:hypothetical protein